MPLQATSGAASYDAFGGGAVAAIPYIEDVFSTYLYTGTGASQTITNNIDLSTKGGLTWIKGRSGATGNRFTDTARGVTKSLASNSDAAEVTESTGLTAFGTTGFTIGADADYNTSTATYASWTFREQTKFFDVVTYTGTGSNTTISHSLGSVPACIMVKRTDTTGAWQVYHRSLANTEYLVLNTDVAKATGATRWNSTTPTSTVFSIGTDATVNASGGTYVAYLFAHDAGGFGLTGTDNVISCGSYSGSSGSVNLGYEPQWILVKQTDSANNWRIFDNMRGWGVSAVAGSGNAALYPNTSGAEVDSAGYWAAINSTGFSFDTGGGNYIYIAIRRGPMKVPTSGTSVFSPQTYAGNGTSPRNLTSGFTTDLVIGGGLSGSGANIVEDRLRGNAFSQTFDTAADTTGASASSFATNNGYILLNTGGSGWNASGTNYGRWMFQRAPSFFDEVCYLGNSTNGRAVAHNLGVTPELMIIKCRTTGVADGWGVWHKVFATGDKHLILNTTAAETTTPSFTNYNDPTATNFYLSNQDYVNGGGDQYVAYLFATCAGVSKVGSYTGTGALQTINCGFTGGARFVLIKRTDNIGDWYTYDSAAGISSGNDPYMRLNSGGAQVTGTNYVDTDSTGFKVTAAAPAGLNASGGTYIFLAIA